MSNYSIDTMDGLLRCTYYAFGPNRLHYCGPDANREVLAYMKNGTSNTGLHYLLKSFQTLYPYLRHIAWNNNIKDPFDDRVVEAYWIGNELLERVNKKKFYHYLLEEQKIKKKHGIRFFDSLTETLKIQAVPHHSFHVFNAWKHTGSLEEIVNNLDSCRISWGKVIEIDGANITIETEPLVYNYSQKQFSFGELIQKKISRGLDANYEIEQLKIGQMITLHWGMPCEVITSTQLDTLKKYTLRHMKLAQLEN